MVAWEPLTPQQFGAIRRGRPTAMPCLRPGCHKTCTYRQTGSGRQKLFCSDSCRVTYTRMRQRLADLWLTLEWNMGYLEPIVPLDDLTRMQTHVAWELERYGGLQDSDYLRLPEEPSADGLSPQEHREQLLRFHGGRSMALRPEVAAARTRRLLARVPDRQEDA